jgi:hypothetical protein
METRMNWQGDRCEYLLLLQERLYPGDWKSQALVWWAVYGEGLDLTGDPERDRVAIRTHLADANRLETLHLKEGITSGQGSRREGVKA